MIDKKLLEVLTTPPDTALAIVTQGLNEPHVVNSWNSYVHVTNDGKLLVPAGRMVETEKNVENNSRVLLTVTNREVQGKSYKGTGFLIKGTAEILGHSNIGITMDLYTHVLTDMKKDAANKIGNGIFGIKE